MDHVKPPQGFGDGNGGCNRARREDHATHPACRPHAADGAPAPRWAGLRDAVRFPGRLWRHLIEDGLGVALAFAVREAAQLAGRRLRDPGERVAERYLKATGHRIVARNWRSPRDRRDEADLVALSPDRRTLLIVEVKRASGPWDALDRVDPRKREVLWRLLADLTSGRDEARGILRSARAADSVRVDLIGVRGEDGTSAVVRHLVGLLERRIGRRERLLDRTRAGGLRTEADGMSHGEARHVARGASRGGPGDGRPVEVDADSARET